MARGIAVAVRSERGRRELNEDAVCALQADSRYLAVLADGAGGHRDGAEAARRAVARLESELDRPSRAFEPDVLTHAVLAAHEHVRAGVDADSPLAAADRMHSTVVVLWIDVLHGALWTHVGDSRLYRARDGHVDRLTSDDSVVQQLVDAGLMTAQEAAGHPHKNQLVAALGVAEDIEPHTSLHATELRQGDAFLLCSDGWWDALDDACIADTLIDARSPDDWLDAMRRRIEALDAPHQDNFSAVGVWIGDAGEGTLSRVP